MWGDEDLIDEEYDEGKEEARWARRVKARKLYEERAERWQVYGEEYWKKEDEDALGFSDLIEEKAVEAAESFEGAVRMIVQTYFGISGSRTISESTWAELHANTRLLYLAAYRSGQQEQLFDRQADSSRKSVMMLRVALSSILGGEGPDASAIRMMAAGQGTEIPEEDIEAYVERVETRTTRQGPKGVSEEE